MQERLDELNEDLSDKIAENEELKQEIFDLNNKIDNLDIKIQQKDDNIKELNQQIEALDTTNEVFEKNIEELSNYKKLIFQLFPKKNGIQRESKRIDLHRYG